MLSGMSDAKSRVCFEQLFDLPENHSLRPAGSYKLKRDCAIYETSWLNEIDDRQTLVSRYRTWTHRSLKPPYRRQTGWERFSPTGELLDREVRYSKRDDMQYLH